MRIHVKICGITRLDDALLAEELGASAVGFVFYPPSSRVISPENAGTISCALGPFIARIGVFVDEDPGMVMETVRKARLTAVQLHGSESPEYVRELQGVRIIKAFRIGKDFDSEILGRYDVSAYLLDAYSECSYGGTGQTFDWERAVACSRFGRIILAGGLTANNIGNAVRMVKPWGVDVSSGIERQPGEKDPEKMRAFFNTIKRELAK